MNCISCGTNFDANSGRCPKCAWNPQKSHGPLAGYLKGELVNDRYTVRESLGVGHLGSVVKAIDLQSNRAVALKFIHPALIPDEKAGRRFLEGMESLKGETHEGICQVLDAGHDGKKRYYVARELLYGVTISQLMEDQQICGQTYPLDEAVLLIQKLSRALTSIKDVAHGTFSPSKIWVLTEQIKVVDHGLAHFLPHSAVWHLLRSSKSPSWYLAPELQDSKNLPPESQCDVYSLAVLLGEMLSLAEFNGKVDIFRESEPDFPVEVDALLRCALSNDADARYFDTMEFVAALFDVTGHERTLTMPPDNTAVVSSNFLDRLRSMSEPPPMPTEAAEAPEEGATEGKSGIDAPDITPSPVQPPMEAPDTELSAAEPTVTSPPPIPDEEDDLPESVDELDDDFGDLDDLDGLDDLEDLDDEEEDDSEVTRQVPMGDVLEDPEEKDQTAKEAPSTPPAPQRPSPPASVPTPPSSSPKERPTPTQPSPPPTHYEQNPTPTPSVPSAPPRSALPIPATGQAEVSKPPVPSHPSAPAAPVAPPRAPQPPSDAKTASPSPPMAPGVQKPPAPPAAASGRPGMPLAQPHSAPFRPTDLSALGRAAAQQSQTPPSPSAAQSQYSKQLTPPPLPSQVKVTPVPRPTSELAGPPMPSKPVPPPLPRRTTQRPPADDEIEPSDLDLEGINPRFLRAAAKIEEAKIRGDQEHFETDADEEEWRKQLEETSSGSVISFLPPVTTENPNEIQGFPKNQQQVKKPKIPMGPGGGRSKPPPIPTRRK